MADFMGMTRTAANRALAFNRAALAGLAKADSPAAHLGRTGVSAMSTLAFSMANGYFDLWEYADLTAAGGFIGAGLLAQSWQPLADRTIGSMSPVMQALPSVAHGIGAGALSSFMAKLGTGLGASMAAKKTETAGYGGRYNGMAGVGALTADEATLYAR